MDNKRIVCQPVQVGDGWKQDGGGGGDGGNPAGSDGRKDGEKRIGIMSYVLDLEGWRRALVSR